jgi:hypothetical protein
VSPARALASLESVPGYGPSTPALLASYDRPTQSWRTSQLCLDGELSVFSETFPKSGMTRSGRLFLLPTLELPTLESESGLWPTPDAGAFNISESPESFMARAERMGKKHSHATFKPPLGVAVKMWPTPTSRDYRSENCSQDYAEKRNSEARGKSLPWMAKMFPTPRSSGITMGGGSNQRKAAAARGTLVSGALNPTWVEWLMGFPLGWTVCDPSEMRSSRRSRRSSGKRSSKRNNASA